MDKPMQTDTSTAGIRGIATSLPAASLDFSILAGGDDSEVQAASRMEDEGGPPLPEGGRGPRAGTAPLQ
jgi:hypothetical protein